MALGEANAAPALLQRQSCVAGFSDGTVLVKPPATQPAQLRSTMDPLNHEMLKAFADVPLRNSMVAGRLHCLSLSHTHVVVHLLLEVPISFWACLVLYAFTQCAIWQQPHAKHAQDHESDAALCQITVQRMSVPYAGFVETVREFEDWTELLLLDALQRSGFFLADSPAITLAVLQARVPAGYKRFIAEATDLLKASGDIEIQLKSAPS